MKGTSNEKNTREILDNTILLVSAKDESPRESVLSRGRSNQSCDNHYTLHSQCFCFLECSISYS